MSKTLERRAFAAQMETRQNADGTVGIRGYAAVFNSEAHGEVVRSSAFNGTLRQRDNVRLLVNHDGVPLASTKAGTMSLSVDERGLLVDVPSLDPANPTAAEIISAMNRGDIDQMSFAFIASDDPMVDGVRELRECRLFDVSVVTFPWYEETKVGLTGDREVDRALVSFRSLTPEQREITLVALGDLNVTAPLNDSSVELDDDDECDDDCCCPECGAACPSDAAFCPSCGAPVPTADPSMPLDPAGTMTVCPECGGQTPALSQFCCCCGVSMPTNPSTIPTELPRSYSIAEARALLGLPAA